MPAKTPEQAVLIERYTTSKDQGQWRTSAEAVLYITSLGAEETTPEDLLALVNPERGLVDRKIFSDEGRTPIAAGKRIEVSLNGGHPVGSGITLPGGQYTATLTGATMTGGTLIAVYLKSNTEKGAMVTLGSGSSMTGI